MPIKYKDEVLGKRVEIAFYVAEDHDNVEFYAGTIKKLTMELKNVGGGAIDFKHFVSFDDGDEDWFCLDKLDKGGDLRWLDTTTTDTNPAVAEKTKKEEDDANMIKEDPTPVASKKEESSPIKDEENAEQTPAAIKTESTHFKTKKEEEAKPAALSAISSPKTKLPKIMPKSIDAILKYMDDLEPGEDYHERQADSRGGCSSTRGKLRNHAKKYPDDPAVAHWVETNSWEPPNQEVLEKMIELLKQKVPKKK